MYFSFQTFSSNRVIEYNDFTDVIFEDAAVLAEDEDADHSETYVADASTLGDRFV